MHTDWQRAVHTLRPSMAGNKALLSPVSRGIGMHCCCWGGAVLRKALRSTLVVRLDALLDGLLQGLQPILLPWLGRTLSQEDPDKVCIHLVEVVLLVPALLHGHTVAARGCPRASMRAGMSCGPNRTRRCACCCFRHERRGSGRRRGMQHICKRWSGSRQLRGSCCSSGQRMCARAGSTYQAQRVAGWLEQG